MDLCADQLLAHLPTATPDLATDDLAPPFRRRAQRLPILGRRRAAFNADRLYNRHLALPRAVRRATQFDLFHITDHTYAHIALTVPPGKCGVYCHDLDAFKSVLDPAGDPRPWWYRQLARRTLAGLQAAALVFHNSVHTGQQLASTGLVPPNRLVHAPLGVAAEFTAEAPPGSAAIPGLPEGPLVLHVGSHIPRKRIDVLVDVFAGVRAKVPKAKLVQVGPPWSPQTRARIERLGVARSVVQMRSLSRGELAALYRRAAVVLVPSEAEGFGLPAIEALACGAPVIASDIPTLREAGGAAAMYCLVGDVPDWTAATVRILSDPAAAPPREVRLGHAQQFSWQEHARVIGEAYLRLAG
jgi:glycosyltransferase involved in cell wall biosynthesis